MHKDGGSRPPRGDWIAPSDRGPIYRVVWTNHRWVEVRPGEPANCYDEDDFRFATRAEIEVGLADLCWWADVL